MKVIIRGQGPVTLTTKDFVASGGQGSVYAKGATAYKIYTDPSHALPVGKITELSVLREPNIIKPEGVVLSEANVPIGYTMRFVTDTLPLCKVLPRAFREREGLDHVKMLALVRRLQTLVEATHAAGVLIVDLNEMNYLVSASLDDVFAIDVDSYQTPNYPATAIMPSVRDWTVKGHDFTQGSDWFSFACVAYHMFTSIHPFKGKHPTISGLEDRMKAGVSVLDASVTVPNVVYPTSVIPPGYRAWFKAVLQDGQRIPPPTDPGTFIAAIVTSRAVISGAVLDITEVHAFRDTILGFLEFNGTVVGWLRDGVWVNGRPVLGPTHTKAVGFSPKLSHVIVAWIDAGQLRLQDATTQRDIPIDMRVDDVKSTNGRIYARSAEQVVEILFHEMGSQIVTTVKVVTNVLERATQMYPGVVIQDMLGSAFVSVYPASGLSYQMRIKELEAYKIVESRFEHRVLMVVGAISGRYDRLTIVFDEGYDTYTVVRTVKDITLTGLNFICLDNGVCVQLTEEEKLEVWNIAAPNKMRVVEDKALGNDMRLIKYGGRLGFIRGDKVFAMRMR